MAPDDLLGIGLVDLQRVNWSRRFNGANWVPGIRCAVFFKEQHQFHHPIKATKNGRKGDQILE